MQIKLNFVSKEDIVLPIHYNSTLQGFIYYNIDEELSDFLHEKGYMYGRRSFKLFTFSRILTRGKKFGKYFNFGKEVEIIIASPIERFCRSLINNMLAKESLSLGKNKLRLSNIDIIETDLDEEEIRVATLSAIVNYSTFIRGDGRKYTQYYRYGDREFDRMLEDNIYKKYSLFYDRKPDRKRLEIKLEGKESQNIVYYRNTIIKGSSGIFTLKGDSDILKLALDTGLGSKNSQGFGLVRRL